MRFGATIPLPYLELLYKSILRTAFYLLLFKFALFSYESQSNSTISSVNINSLWN